MANASVVNRRDFLKDRLPRAASPSSSASISLRALLPTSGGPGKKPPNPFDAWVRIAPDNKVTLDSWKVRDGSGDHDGAPMDPPRKNCAWMEAMKCSKRPPIRKL